MAAVVRGCADVLEGRDIDEGLVLALGGLAGVQVLAGRAGGRHGYWPRVWGARGLLYAWDDFAIPAIIRATADDAWRVREMAAKVIARRGVGDAMDAVAALREDSVPRVRTAAERAVARLTAGLA
jgi:HEAT repeat protein